MLVRPAPPLGRRQEFRDRLAARLHRRKVIVSVLIAALLGGLVAILTSPIW